METHLFFSLVVLCFLSQTCHGGVLFSTLPRTLVVSASPLQGQVLRAGEDRITVTWGLNKSLERSETDESYKKVKVILCYAPISQIDRGWRKTEDNLSKDKTCQFTIVTKPYERSQRFEWTIERDVPSATYFVRVYAYDSQGEEVAFGQTTDAKKSSNLFDVRGISGRHLSLEIASVCFSAFSLVSLFGFFLLEKRNGKGSPKN